MYDSVMLRMLKIYRKTLHFVIYDAKNWSFKSKYSSCDTFVLHSFSYFVVFVFCRTPHIHRIMYAIHEIKRIFAKKNLIRMYTLYSFYQRTKIGGPLSFVNLFRKGFKHNKNPNLFTVNNTECIQN